MTCVSSTMSGTNPRQHGCANSSMDVICPPGRSIPGQLEMFGQTICETSTSAISSQELAAGPSPCAGQDLKERPVSGPDHRHVSPFPSLEKGLDKLTNGTLPPSGSTSSASASLASFLGSRLKRQFGSDGSMIYSMRWKNAATPAGRQYCQLVASARRISASDCSSERSGWNTPTCNVFNQPETARGLSTLAGQSKLSGWPTPQASDGSGGGQAKRAMNPDRSNDLMDFAMLAGWPTPTTRDHKDGQECPNVPTNSLLGREVWKADQPIRITASGQALTGSDAGTASSGQLNPAHSRWLQGYPPAWCDCAATAMQSFPRSRRNSSRNSSAQSPTCKTKG